MVWAGDRLCATPERVGVGPEPSARSTRPPTGQPESGAVDVELGMMRLHVWLSPNKRPYPRIEALQTATQPRCTSSGSAVSISEPPPWRTSPVLWSSWLLRTQEGDLILRYPPACPAVRTAVQPLSCHPSRLTTTGSGSPFRTLSQVRPGLTALTVMPRLASGPRSSAQRLHRRLQRLHHHPSRPRAASSRCRAGRVGDREHGAQRGPGFDHKPRLADTGAR